MNNSAVEVAPVLATSAWQTVVGLPAWQALHRVGMTAGGAAGVASGSQELWHRSECKGR